MHGPIVIDNGMLKFRTEEGHDTTIPLYSPEGFIALSSLWLKVAWNERYHYSYTWMGAPILQLPEDLIRLQEVVWQLKPDVIIETGVALGGSLLFYATLCKALGKGRVIGVEIDLHPPNRKRLEEHPLSSFLTVIEGNSTDPQTVASIQALIDHNERVLVVLDSNHSKQHVAQELELYAPLVSSGSYLVVADGFKKQLTDVPRGKKEWIWDNPAVAVEEFLIKHTDFIMDPPRRLYNQSSLSHTITHFDQAWLRKQ